MVREHRGGRAAWPGQGIGLLLSQVKRRRQERARTAAGTVWSQTRPDVRISLRRPLASGGVRKRRTTPLFWRSLVFPLAGGRTVPEQRLNGWLLVLAAKKIPHIFQASGYSPKLYVPPLQEGVALHEIRAFEAERSLPVLPPPAHDNIWGVILFLLLLFVWHGLRWGWFSFSLPVPPFPGSAREWSLRFGLDVYQFRFMHEYWRAFTALTLHADDSHLLGNLGFGLLFFGFFCRRAGLGLGCALAVAAGFLGNAGNALTRAPNVISIGFSTALFGAVGCLCAFSAADVFRRQNDLMRLQARSFDLVLLFIRKVAMPLLAGLALLGLLGGGGEARTDYPAHIWGFLCGIALTLALLPLEKRLSALPKRQQDLAQATLFIGTVASLASAWAYSIS